MKKKQHLSSALLHTPLAIVIDLACLTIGARGVARVGLLDTLIPVTIADHTFIAVLARGITLAGRLRHALRVAIRIDLTFFTVLALDVVALVLAHRLVALQPTLLTTRALVGADREALIPAAGERAAAFVALVAVYTLFIGVAFLVRGGGADRNVDLGTLMAVCAGGLPSCNYRGWH